MRIKEGMDYLISQGIDKEVALDYVYTLTGTVYNDISVEDINKCDKILSLCEEDYFGIKKYL